MARSIFETTKATAFSSNQRFRHLAYAGLILAAGTLAGCAVTPEAITDADRFARVESDTSMMFKDQEPVHGPIGLAEAVARGLKYNLDKRLKEFEVVLTEKGLAHSAIGMLPQLAASAGYHSRNDFRGSSSKSLITGVESLEVSTSEDKQITTADLRVVWNVLDFGLTYLRTQQEADRVLIAKERHVKVVQNIVQDMRDAYWRAVAAELMLPRVGQLIDRIEAALRSSQAVQHSGSGEPADELRLQRTLLESLKDMKEVRRNLSLAKAELAALMNLPPGTSFRVSAPAMGSLHVPRIRAKLADLEQASLLNRPELREEDYKKRISKTELDAAYVRLLPGIELSTDGNFDSNSFLFKNTWSTVAGAVTKNLMELLTADRSINFAKADVDVADQRRMTLSMAIIAQTHISLQRYALSQEVFNMWGRLYRVDSQLAEVAAESSSSADGSAHEALAAQARKTVSELQYLSAYADVQNAFGRILNSVGAHRLPDGIEGSDLKTLTGEVRSFIDDWRIPDLPVEVAKL